MFPAHSAMRSGGDPHPSRWKAFQSQTVPATRSRGKDAAVQAIRFERKDKPFMRLADKIPIPPHPLLKPVGPITGPFHAQPPSSTSSNNFLISNTLPMSASAPAAEVAEIHIRPFAPTVSSNGNGMGSRENGELGAINRSSPGVQ